MESFSLKCLRVLGGVVGGLGDDVGGGLGVMFSKDLGLGVGNALDRLF